MRLGFGRNKQETAQQTQEPTTRFKHFLRLGRRVERYLNTFRRATPETDEHARGELGGRTSYWIKCGSPEALALMRSMEQSMWNGPDNGRVVAFFETHGKPRKD